MIGGFLGTLINLERGVALHGFLKSSPVRGLPYLAPLFSAAGAVALVFDLSFAAWLMTFSSIGMVLIFAYIIRKQTAFFTLTMGMGAVCWFIGNVIWLQGNPLYRSVPWWMAFLVLTIAGERLELARLMHHARSSTYLFMGIVGTLLVGLVYTQFDDDIGIRVMGVGNIGIALWLLRYDIVRRTIRQTGLPRFIAVCLTVGYVWLAVSGMAAVFYGSVKAGMIYDVILHAVFLGFVFSMIFGHAPMILPSVMGVTMNYSPHFYGHLILLHISLLLRVGGDLSTWQDGRRWGAMLNAIVLVLFFLNTIRSLQTAEAKPLIPRTRPAYATYALSLPLAVVGFVMIGIGLLKGLQDEPPSTPSPISITEGTGDEMSYTADSIATGEKLYQANCSPCHGINLQGVPGTGKNLVKSAFVAAQTDAELHAFILRGRPLWDALNTTGVEMPPRGGNPSLSDADINHIIAFIRTKAKD
jgi:cytochrome c5